MDHGDTKLTEKHQCCSFHLQNQGTSSGKISVVVQFGCRTEEGALQIAWDKKTLGYGPWKQPEVSKLPERKENFPRAARLYKPTQPVLPVPEKGSPASCKLLGRFNKDCRRPPCEQQEYEISTPWTSVSMQIEILSTVCWERAMLLIFLLHSEGGCKLLDLMLDTCTRVSILFKSML